jgi:uncharacterized protein (DUF1800 family)
MPVRLLLLTTVSLAAFGAGSGPVPANGRVLPADTTRALHLLDRATWGARPEDLEQLLRVGSTMWLDRQLHPERIDNAALEARLAGFPAAGMTVDELLRAYPPPQRGKAKGKAVGAGKRMEPDTARPRLRRRRRGRSPNQVVAQLATAKLQRAVYSERQLEEVMTDFWFNHFNVYARKRAVRWLVADYERAAIRPHVFGKFEDMLVATAKHPAMLIYLDNWTSTVPDSLRDRGARGERSRGINENYARELMELHTLGVDGGYTQQDVVEVARAFTGWTLSRPQSAIYRGEGGVDFAFRPSMHDRREKSALGHRLPAGRGIEDGRDVLRVLAHHPSTARHVARKLVERFVSDQPPPALVDRLAAVFLQTGGDLREVTRGLFLSPEFNDPTYRRAKVKTPFEFVASALRVTRAEAGGSRGVIQALQTFGHAPYLATAPTGYPNTMEEWTNGGAMLNRMNFALALGSGTLDRVRVDPSFLDASDPLRSARLVLFGRNATRASEVIRSDLDSQGGLAGPGAAQRALGLALGSPEFQRR